MLVYSRVLFNDFGGLTWGDPIFRTCRAMLEMATSRLLLLEVVESI
jgi:hypothetical protein